jgi:hypothetical protein
VYSTCSYLLLGVYILSIFPLFTISQSTTVFHPQLQHRQARLSSNLFFYICQGVTCIGDQVFHPACTHARPHAVEISIKKNQEPTVSSAQEPISTADGDGPAYRLFSSY